MTMPAPWRLLVVLACVMLSVATSCSRGPRPPKQPYIDPSRAGQLALEQYDTNHDGKIAGDELEKAPALKAALKNLDTDGDGAVSADEVAARVNRWKSMQTAFAAVMCKVTLDGEALTGAKVTFDPEPFLGDEIKPAEGTTNFMGTTSPTVALTDPKLPGGTHFGLYRIRISKVVDGKETIPARYNKDTILGHEISYDDPAIMNRNFVIALKRGQ